VLWAPDSSDKWAPDPGARDQWALDSSAGPLTLGAAVEHFLTAKAAEGASPKTIDWYRMVLGRAARELGPSRPLEALTPTELRVWLLHLSESLSPISVAGYLRGVKAFGNWCAAEQLAQARSLRSLRRPQVRHKLVEPLDDDALRRLLDAASVRDRPSCCSCSTPACGCLRWLACARATFARTGARRCCVRAPTSGSFSLVTPPGRRWCATCASSVRRRLISTIFLSRGGGSSPRR